MTCARTTLLVSLSTVLAGGLSRDALAEQASEHDTYQLADSPLCVDETEVVGYRRCTPYGAWSQLPERYVFIEYGMSWRHFTDTRPASVAARSATMTSPASESTEAIVFAERLGFGLARGTYLAFEVEIGNFAFDAKEGDRDIIVGGLGAFGFRGGIGGIGLGVELGAGYRGYSDPDQSELAGEAILEARARGQLWATPWFTLGAVVGASLLDHSEWVAGINLGFHSHAYAGER